MIKMTKKDYVRRLKSMLANKKNACSWCPCTKQYNPHLPAHSNCKICQSFVGLKFKVTNQGGNCPCKRPGRLGAVTRALKKIEEYEAKHGKV